MQRSSNNAFTLIELSIVLVIIGLIVGGVLVGQDLIRAAQVRSQVSQLEACQAAVNTFRGKFNFLPGDIPDPDASQFGFGARGANAGQGDGNGVLEGVQNNSPANDGGEFQSAGETALLWADLSKAGLINGRFTAASATQAVSSPVTASGISAYLPSAMIGSGNYLYVYTGTPAVGAWNGGDGINYFGLSVINAISAGATSGQPGLTVAQAYAIDKKIDDGLPQTGRVKAFYLTNIGSCLNWASGGGVFGAQPGAPNVSGSATTCYQTDANANATYSISQNNGAGVNCGLSFRFQ